MHVCIFVRVFLYQSIVICFCLCPTHLFLRLLLCVSDRTHGTNASINPLIIKQKGSLLPIFFYRVMLEMPLVLWFLCRYHALTDIFPILVLGNLFSLFFLRFLSSYLSFFLSFYLSFFLFKFLSFFRCFFLSLLLSLSFLLSHFLPSFLSFFLNFLL